MKHELASADVGIHQVLVAASPGDAITNLALATREVLRRTGPSEIFAHHVTPSMFNEVHSIAAYRARHARNVLIFHASIGEREVHRFLTERAEDLVLVYHNVTPAEYFEPYDLAFAELLALGRREVEILRPRVVRAIADSQYNANELIDMGYRNVRIIPPITHIDRFAGVAPRQSTLNHLKGLGAPVLLSVAQLMPHKRPDYLVKMTHIAETYGRAKAVLLLVGHHRLPAYTAAIREQIRELSVDVHLVGPVDDDELVAMYQAASAVVSASEHEGFCLPLVEAMAFRKPVIARACAAVPETVGDAALLVPPSESPAFFAEAVAELLNSSTLAHELVQRGDARLRELGAGSAGVAFADALLEAV
jgi:glycosyltransferase involved in cell wall biosynthesis